MSINDLLRRGKTKPGSSLSEIDIIRKAFKAKNLEEKKSEEIVAPPPVYEEKVIDAKNALSEIAMLQRQRKNVPTRGAPSSTPLPRPY